jgi:hypothetical protein
VGRFIGVDPAKEYASPYVYVGNQPSGYIDPNGKFTVSYNANRNQLVARRRGQINAVYFGIGNYHLTTSIATTIYKGLVNDPSFGDIKTDLGGLAFSAITWSTGSVLEKYIDMTSNLQRTTRSTRTLFAGSISSLFIDLNVQRELFLDEATFIYASALKINDQPLVLSPPGSRDLILNMRLISELSGEIEPRKMRKFAEDLLEGIKAQAEDYFDKTMQKDPHEFLKATYRDGINMEIVNEEFRLLMESIDR